MGEMFNGSGLVRHDPDGSAVGEREYIIVEIPRSLSDTRASGASGGGQGLAFQRRTSAGLTTTHTSGGEGAAPQWVRLTRAANIVTAAVSPDGITWTDVGSDVVGIASQPLLIGIALTSHDNEALATATFDNVAVIP